jgi:hypothetical protein
MNRNAPHIPWRPVLGAALTFALASVPGVRDLQAPASDPLEAQAAVVQHLERGAAPTARPAAVTATASRPYSYGWPVRPFGRQHPVRGFFGDPRIGKQGRSRQFHFGVDISAPNGTPVYATATGRVWIHPLHETTVMISGADGRELSYWHVVPAVRTGARAVAYRTVIGHIETPYAHVHFSEARNGRYLNPLRPGAMGPFEDGTRPWVRSVAEERGGGAIVAEVYDETPLAIPRPWHDLPVMPALVRWQLRSATGRVLMAWRTVVDFRQTIPPASAFDEIWAAGVMQNHVRAPGRYRLVLARDLAPGRYLVEVAVQDASENRTSARYELRVADR